MSANKFEVPAEKLRIDCDPQMFNFKCTKELAPLREFIGQERAIAGIEFGLSMKNSGYNIYVSGLSGTGKTSAVKTYVNSIIKQRFKDGTFRPDDWCYIYNFVEPDKPRIVKIPMGKAKLSKNMYCPCCSN